MEKKAKIQAISITAVIAAVFIAIILAIQIPTLKIDTQYANTINVDVGSDFEDAGADIYLGKVKLRPKIYSSTKVDTQVLGEYKLTYDARFLWRRVSKTVNVIVNDDQAPKIELIYSGKKTQPGEDYVEEGFKAYDNYDGDITALVEVKRVDNKIYYTVKDSSGNIATAERTVIFDDNQAPKITLNGEQEITIALGEVFDDPGVNAVDNVDGNLTQKVVAVSNIDNKKAGTYTVEYRVRDSAGNEAVARRTVKVEQAASGTAQQPSQAKKVIYLTFDDGPSKYTPKLLSVLKKYNVKATFFVVGNGNKLEYLEDIAKDGHSIGLHTMTHNYSKVYSSEKAFMNEIQQLRRLVYNRTGIDTTMIRFPGGSSNTISKRYNKGIMTRLVSRVAAEGYKYYDWNVSSGDAGEVHTTWQVYNNVVEGVRRQDVSIVLQHDTMGFSVDAVENIIKWGISNGYSFKRLTPDGPTVHHDVNN